MVTERPRVQQDTPSPFGTAGTAQSSCPARTCTIQPYLDLDMAMGLALWGRVSDVTCPFISRILRSTYVSTVFCSVPLLRCRPYELLEVCGATWGKDKCGSLCVISVKGYKSDPLQLRPQHLLLIGERCLPTKRARKTLTMLIYCGPGFYSGLACLLQERSHTTWVCKRLTLP